MLLEKNARNKYHRFGIRFVFFGWPTLLLFSWRYIFELSVELAKDQCMKEIIVPRCHNFHRSLIKWHGLWPDLYLVWCHVNLLLETAHFLVPTVVQVEQGQRHVGFNQYRTRDPVYVMSGGSTRNSVRTGAFYQDVKSSTPLSSFP